jgi:RNA polymerase sigma-70 factor (subfamily 1)
MPKAAFFREFFRIFYGLAGPTFSFQTRCFLGDSWSGRLHWSLASLSSQVNSKFAWKTCFYLASSHWSLVLAELSQDPFEQSNWDDQSMSARLDAAIKGDHQARSRLLTDLKRYLEFVATRQFDEKLQAKMGPSDIVQQSMIHAVENLDQFRGKSMDEFRGWLRQILVNEARQMKRDLRAQKRDVQRERRLTDSQSHHFQGYLVDGMPTPCTNACSEEQAREIQAALTRLSDEDRQIIQWRNWDGLAFEEIAERLNISLSTASRKWYRALIAFKSQLSGDHE